MASPFTIVPPYKELENSLEKYTTARERKGERPLKFDPEEVQNIVSGLFNSAYAFGCIYGPLFGGYVTMLTEFRTTTDIQGLIMGTCATLQLLIVYVPMKVMEKRILAESKGIRYKKMEE